ncbi:hypothetical protein C0416_01970 [bacterium]|nr:hypothetical protein [bacterium]
MKKFAKYCMATAGLFLLFTSSVNAQSYATTQPDYCTAQLAANVKPSYDFEFLGTKKNLSFEKEELAEVTIYIKNTGTIPMFSDESGCTLRPTARLGTARDRDRDSAIFVNKDGWQSPNRLRMDQKVLNPGEKGSFTFTAKMPSEEGIYKEYFDLVLEGKQWMNKEFAVSFDVGEYIAENRDYLQYVDKSGRITKDDLNGEKSIEIVIATQKMYLKVGSIVIREFPVSTGTYKTPTPYGETKILNKQEVRVSGAWPHYIMPKWMGFRAGGYGIHALPSIRYDNGYYWREALSHIGTRRSHGCIRLLPKDAEFAYGFGEIGTKVTVR